MKIPSQRDTTPKHLPSILEALQVIDFELGTVGWIQGAQHTDQGFCVVGAANVFPGRKDAKWWALRYIEDAAKTYSIVTWNDAPGRTYKQVDAAIQKAIKQVKKELARE